MLETLDTTVLMSSTSWPVTSLLRIRVSWAVALSVQGKISSRAVLLEGLSTHSLIATHVSAVALMRSNKRHSGFELTKKKKLMKRQKTYLCSRRNVPLKMKVPVTKIHPRITRLHKRKKMIQIVFKLMKVAQSSFLLTCKRWLASQRLKKLKHKIIRQLRNM